MLIKNLHGKNIVIWGTGREGNAAADFIRAQLPDAAITFVDEASGGDIAGALKAADIVVKSPGVSLYHPLLKGKNVTSLMNLWFAAPHAGKTICITGTKGKSTTSFLLAHVLTHMGYKATAVGNIGVPISEAPQDSDYIVIETSSYQAANFDGECDIAAVTSLYPEHLDWHGDFETYARDKLHILGQAKTKIVHRQVAETVHVPRQSIICEDEGADIPNDYLSRPHNRANVAIVLKIVESLGLDQARALAAMADFKGLPHRQFELGEKDGILYVDDSIATTPQAAMAAMDVYRRRPLTLIVGGHDRGVDYTTLAAYIKSHAIQAVIGLGASGARILDQVPGQKAANMEEAVRLAKAATPAGGVILLSPAAPSFGLFKNYIERGEAFARESGF